MISPVTTTASTPEACSDSAQVLLAGSDADGQSVDDQGGAVV